eukprot:3693226-Rhodomonas_salina.1
MLPKQPSLDLAVFALGAVVVRRNAPVTALVGLSSRPPQLAPHSLEGGCPPHLPVLHAPLLVHELLGNGDHLRVVLAPVQGDEVGLDPGQVLRVAEEGLVISPTAPDGGDVREAHLNTDWVVTCVAQGTGQYQNCGSL